MASSKQSPEFIGEEIKKCEFISKILWPHGDWFRGHVSKKGAYIIGYGNDYPMQHGDGVSITVTKEVVDYIYQSEMKKLSIQQC